MDDAQLETLLEHDFNPLPIEVSLKSPEWKKPQVLPGCARKLYEAMNAIPDELCVSKTFEFGGWAIYVMFKRDRAREVMKYLYQDDVPQSVTNLLGDIQSNELTLLGFGD